MRRLALFCLLLVLFALPAPPAAADGTPKLLQMVPLLPLADGDHPDIDALMGQYWRGYWKVDSELGFGPADLRVGRIDLDGDGEDELVVLVDKPKWRTADGQSMVIATWRNHAWQPVGWGWSDDDSLFVTDEVIGGWHSIDSGTLVMRWTGKIYRRDPKPQAATSQATD